MKKIAVLLSLTVLATSCTSISYYDYKVSEFKKHEELTKRGPIQVGPLSKIPEDTVQSVINEIDAGKCTPSQNVRIKVDATSIMGFTYKKEATYSCE